MTQEDNQRDGRERALDESKRESPLRLRISFYSRFVAFFRGFFPLTFGTLAIVSAFQYALTRTDEPLQARTIVALIGWHAGSLGLALGWLMMRTAVVRRARLMVDEGGVRLEHKGMLRLPLVISKATIKLAAVETDPPRRRFGLRDSKRFHLPTTLESSNRLPEWLYSRSSGSPFPLLSHVTDPPNVALLFNETISTYQARRTTKVFPVKGPVHMVRPRLQTRGLMLRVADPEAARNAFEEHGLLGTLTAREVEQVAPGVAQRDRARARSTRANLLTAAIIALNLLGPALAEGHFGPSERSLFRSAVESALRFFGAS